MKHCITVALVLGAGALIGARPAAAQVRTETTSTYNWSDPSLETGIGVEAAIGGGVAGFTDKTMRDATSNVTGLWDARVSIGTHIPLGVEISYVGTASGLRVAGDGMNVNVGDLVGTTVEATGRFNILPHEVLTPFLFAGVGWTRYTIQNFKREVAPVGMRNVNSVSELPMGVGLAFRNEGLVIDVRGTLRVAEDQTLVPLNSTVDASSVVSSNFAPMHSWEASAAIGYEF